MSKHAFLEIYNDNIVQHASCGGFESLVRGILVHVVGSVFVRVKLDDEGVTYAMLCILDRVIDPSGDGFDVRLTRAWVFACLLQTEHFGRYLIDISNSITMIMFMCCVPDQS
jgi:hypothetical protein